jgi:hypothetical protein
MEIRTSVAGTWLQSKFEAWRYHKGIRKTLTEFAAFIGITEEKLLSYLDGSEMPKGSNLAKIGAVLGFEIYELLGIDTCLMLDTLPPLFRVRFASAFTEYYETIKANSYDKESPEAQATLNEMIRKFKLPETFAK